MTHAEIKRAIFEYLTNLPGWVRMEGSASVGEGLIDRRVLDSLRLLQFVTFVEELCGIKVPSDDITAEHFNNIEDLLCYLESMPGVIEAA